MALLGISVKYPWIDHPYTDRGSYVDPYKRGDQYTSQSGWSSLISSSGLPASHFGGAPSGLLKRKEPSREEPRRSGRGKKRRKLTAKERAAIRAEEDARMAEAGGQKRAAFSGVQRESIYDLGSTGPPHMSGRRRKPKTKPQRSDPIHRGSSKRRKIQKQLRKEEQRKAARKPEVVQAPEPTDDFPSLGRPKSPEPEPKLPKPQLSREEIAEKRLKTPAIADIDITIPEEVPWGHAEVLSDYPAGPQKPRLVSGIDAFGEEIVHPLIPTEPTEDLMALDDKQRALAEGRIDMPPLERGKQSFGFREGSDYYAPKYKIAEGPLKMAKGAQEQKPFGWQDVDPQAKLPPWASRSEEDIQNQRLIDAAQGIVAHVEDEGPEKREQPDEVSPEDASQRQEALFDKPMEVSTGPRTIFEEADLTAAPVVEDAPVAAEPTQPDVALSGPGLLLKYPK